MGLIDRFRKEAPKSTTESTTTTGTTDAVVMPTDALLLVAGEAPEILDKDLEELVVFSTEEQPDMIGLRLQCRINGEWVLGRDFVTELVHRARAGDLTMMVQGDVAAQASGSERSHMKVAVRGESPFALSLKAADLEHFLLETATDEGAGDESVLMDALDAELAKILAIDKI